MPNLDCMDDEQLEQFITNAREMFPRVLVMCHLADYAECLLGARFNRLRGDIPKALAWEAQCERIYKRLPKYARW